MTKLKVDSDSKTFSLYVQCCHMKKQLSWPSVSRLQRVAWSWRSPLIQNQIAGCEVNFVMPARWIHTCQTKLVKQTCWFIRRGIRFILMITKFVVIIQASWHQFTRDTNSVVRRLLTYRKSEQKDINCPKGYFLQAMIGLPMAPSPISSSQKTYIHTVTNNFLKSWLLLQRSSVSVLWTAQSSSPPPRISFLDL